MYVHYYMSIHFGLVYKLILVGLVQLHVIDWCKGSEIITGSKVEKKAICLRAFSHWPWIYVPLRAWLPLVMTFVQNVARSSFKKDPPNLNFMLSLPCLLAVPCSSVAHSIVNQEALPYRSAVSWLGKATMSIYGSIPKTFLVVGTLLGGSAVGVGAFATHSLRGVLDDNALSLVRTAVQYQMYHALALLAVGLLCLWQKEPSLALKISGSAFIVGVLGFSGSLYGLSFNLPIWFGFLTPMGGLFLLIGWGSLAIAALNL
jgi:uncharacterized membrane protein YgdD (TMEM256/DUF423 family)